MCLAAPAHRPFVSTVDWIVADILAIRQNALGHVRYVLKDGLKWLPLYGCYFSQVRGLSSQLGGSAGLGDCSLLTHHGVEGCGAGFSL